MQKILRKRILRDLRENLFRYLALGLLIVLGMYMIISLVGAADTIMIGSEKKAEENRREDGEFTVFVPLSGQQKERLADEGVEIEEHFYLDYLCEDGKTIRVFKNRERIDLTAVEQGELPGTQEEIALERRFCEENHISVGDGISFGGKNWKVTGIVSAADYEAPYRNLSDSAVDSEMFGVGFVSADTYEELREAGKSVKTEEFVYAYRFEKAMTDDELKEMLQDFTILPEDVEDIYFQRYWSQTYGDMEDFAMLVKMMGGEAWDSMKEYLEPELANLIQLIPAEDNMRIGAAGDDQIINKECGLFAGVIILILFTYVISVFVIHGIEKECSIIGTLYALGVRRKELIAHYLTLPVLVTFIAGIIGTFLGYSRLGVDVQMRDCYVYYSLPSLQTIYEPYLFVYGLLLPPAVAAAVNYLVIRKKLSQPALKMIRKEQKVKKSRNISLGNLGFVKKFQIRQMIRESRTAFTVFFGMFICLLVVMLSVNCYALCEHISVDNKRDTRFAYMYTYKYPEKEVPEGGEPAFAKSLKKEIYGYNLDVTLLGIEADNPYFDADVREGKNKILVSSAMAQKYGLHTGDKIVLSDEEEDMDYAFTVEGIVTYSPGFYAFMDIGSMRELLGEGDDYYNVVFSDTALDIDSGRLFGTISKEEVEKSADVFVELMASMVITLAVVGALIFAVVMYLMMKVMIDRSAFGISLMKIFGYSTKDIRKLYLNGNFYIVAVSAAIGIPLSKMLMDAAYPYMISNVACGMDLTFSWQMYAGIYLVILALYFLINRMLVGRLKKMVPADVLKNRE